MSLSRSLRRPLVGVAESFDLDRELVTAFLLEPLLEPGSLRQ